MESIGDNTEPLVAEAEAEEQQNRTSPKQDVEDQESAEEEQDEDSSDDNQEEEQEETLVSDGSGMKRKWARQQAQELPSNKYQRTEGHNEYNIWYHRYTGDNERVRVAATTRCDPLRDSGATRADLTRPDTFICIHFAKGCCVHGKKCNYLHRVPTPEDDTRLDLMHDIFGRERHQTDRDDMGGVGTFSRECKTLYIGNLPIDSVKETYKALARHFGMYGPIEGINVKPKFGCAFVRFLYRANAEFAKIAMAEQSLDADEQLNVRWAHEDPNPAVIRQVEAEKKQRVLDALAAQGHSQDAARYNAPANYQPDGQVATRASDPYAYPNTDPQFQQQQAAYQQQYADYQRQYAEYAKQHAAFYGTPAPPPTAMAPHAAAAAAPLAPVVDEGVDAFTPMTPEMYRKQQQQQPH